RVFEQELSERTARLGEQLAKALGPNPDLDLARMIFEVVRGQRRNSLGLRGFLNGRSAHAVSCWMPGEAIAAPTLPPRSLRVGSQVHRKASELLGGEQVSDGHRMPRRARLFRNQSLDAGPTEEIDGHTMRVRE